jgi:antitoxin (DNA-binding transcriptional repressor) of toxin-antitoxin stability system
MESDITTTDLARNLSDVLNRVHYRGETFLVKRGGQTLARLTPTAPSIRTWEEFKTLLSELGPIDKSFSGDLEEVIQAQEKIEASPWER